MKTVLIDKFNHNDASIEFYTTAIDEIKVAVEVGDFEEEKTLEREELKRIIDGLTAIYNGTSKDEIEEKYTQAEIDSWNGMGK